MKASLAPAESASSDSSSETAPPRSISIGTMVRGNGGKLLRRLESLTTGGFECFQFHWWAGIGDEDLGETARRTRDALDGMPGRDGGRPFVSALALYGNPLRDDSEGDESRHSVRELIRRASDFGCTRIGLFSGRLPNTPWEASLGTFVRVFGEFCREAADHGVVLGLENCPMDGDDSSGDWNLAYGPRQWSRLFEALPPDCLDTLGLEWEPAHEIVQGRDPMEGLDPWVGRVVHVHGKDAKRGSDGSVRQTLPGNGQTSWDEIIARLKNAGFRGSIDIEGFHDAQWRGDAEVRGQVRSAAYLRECRDGVRRGPAWNTEGDAS